METKGSLSLRLPLFGELLPVAKASAASFSAASCCCVFSETGGVCISPTPAEPGAEIIPGMAMRAFFGIQPALVDAEVRTPRRPVCGGVRSSPQEKGRLGLFSGAHRVAVTAVRGVAPVCAPDCAVKIRRGPRWLLQPHRLCGQLERCDQALALAQSAGLLFVAVIFLIF